MKADAGWDAGECEFGQRAELTLTATSDTRHPILVHRSTVNFCQTSKVMKESHSIQINPHKSRQVRKISVVIGPWAEKAGATGTIHISYQAKRGPLWGNQETEQFQQDHALTITDARPTGRTIFISHSNRDRDKAVVGEAARIARKLGLEPYVAEDDPSLGDNLWQKILEQVRRCDGLIFLLTKDGGKSCDMREELGYARMRNAMKDGAAAKIVPIVERGVDPQGSFKGEEYWVIDLGKRSILTEQVADVIIDSFAE